MTKTIIFGKRGSATYDNVTDFDIKNGDLILEFNGGQFFHVYAKDHWYEAIINKVAGELTDGTN